MLATANASPAMLAPSRGPSLGFVLSNWTEARSAADELSKSGLIPDYLKGKPADVLVILLQGSVLGVDPITAMWNIFVVKGRPFMASLMRQAIVRNNRECEYVRVVESTAKHCIVETKRRSDPKPVSLTYTYAMAELSGITKQNPKYMTEPDVMLKRRAMSRLLEDVYPDILRGMGDKDEDVEAIEFLARADTGAMARTAPPPSEVKKKPAKVREPEAAPPAEAEYEEPRELAEEEPQEQAEEAAPAEPPVPDLIARLMGVTNAEDLAALNREARALDKEDPVRKEYGKQLPGVQRRLAQGGA